MHLAVTRLFILDCIKYFSVSDTCTYTVDMKPQHAKCTRIYLFSVYVITGQRV